MGGTQYNMQMTWQLTNGAWWLFLTGAGATEPVGYYPVRVFRGGPLATNAVSVKYGGEVTKTTAGAVWPQMGSSNLPGRGFSFVALQPGIYYITQAGSSASASLHGNVVGLPTCWSIAVTNDSGGDWGTYFYFGGPGGTVCTYSTRFSQKTWTLSKHRFLFLRP